MPSEQKQNKKSDGPFFRSALVPGEQGSVTGTNQKPNAIDLYFVNKMFEDAAETTEINAGTVLIDLNGMINFSPPGIIIGSNSVDYSSDSAKRTRQRTRTIAHEFVHILANKGDEIHSNDHWNLTRVGASEMKRDISRSLVELIWEYGLRPGDLGI